MAGLERVTDVSLPIAVLHVAVGESAVPTVGPGPHLVEDWCDLISSGLESVAGHGRSVGVKPVIKRRGIRTIHGKAFGTPKNPWSTFEGLLMDPLPAQGP